MAASTNRALDNSIDPEEVWEQLDHLAYTSLSGLHGALSDHPLCERCASIDLNELLDPTTITSAAGRSVASITSSEPRSCIFCRILWVMGAWKIANDRQRPSMKNVYGSIELRAFRISGGSSLPEFQSKEQVLLALGPKSVSEFHRAFFSGRVSDAYVAISPIQPHDLVISSLKRHYSRNALLNYERINSWIRKCNKSHQSCYTVYNGPPYTIKCIDCQTHTVVKVPITTKYFALSYVWGATGQGGLKRPRQYQLSNQKLQDVPRTIQDAILVVNRLGGRYLWVDQVCVNQEDMVEKHEQISKMNLIYSSAWLTIITPANEDCDQRIPGVSAARAEQLFFGGSHKLELRYGWNGTYLRTEICRTKWSTRGWTYQEFILSRRCLFLTSQRAHFVCDVGVRSEVDEEHVLPPQTEGPLWKLSCLRKDKVIRGLNTHDMFMYHLASYSKRSLSFDSDYLNAFKGVIGHLEIRTVWGLPLWAPEPLNTELARGKFYVLVAFSLLHSVCHSRGSVPKTVESNAGYFHDRIDCFPTWTWAGWKRGKLLDRFDWNFSLENQPETDCTIQVQLKNQARISVDKYYSSRFDESHLSHSLFIRGPCCNFQLRLAKQDAGNIWEVEDIDAWKLHEREDTDYYARIFWDTDDREYTPRPSYEPYPLGNWQVDSDLVSCAGLCVLEYWQIHAIRRNHVLGFLLFVEREGKAYRVGVLRMRWDSMSWLEHIWKHEKEFKRRNIEFV